MTLYITFIRFKTTLLDISYQLIIKIIDFDWISTNFLRLITNYLN